VLGSAKMRPHGTQSCEDELQTCRTKEEAEICVGRGTSLPPLPACSLRRGEPGGGRDRAGTGRAISGVRLRARRLGACDLANQGVRSLRALRTDYEEEEMSENNEVALREGREKLMLMLRCDWLGKLTLTDEEARELARELIRLEAVEAETT